MCIGRIITILVIASTPLTLAAQEKKTKAYRPDIPGYFMIDLGLSNGSNKPAYFNQGFWGSRTLNLYYHYPVPIKNTKFSYNPGAGFSFERFKLTDNYTFNQQPGSDGSYDLISPANFNPSWNIKKSMIITNYFDLMPIEFRFDTNPKDVTRGFNFTIGGRVGALIESHTKIKYSSLGTNGVYKDKQQHGVNPIRYGAYARVGIGNFNLFWFYNFSPYFAPNKGPDLTNMNTFTVGISLNGF